MSRKNTMSAVTYGMSATTYGVATAGTEAAPTRKSLFAWVLDALADSRARQGKREIHRYRHLLANELE
jgi:hypothetical protein